MSDMNRYAALLSAVAKRLGFDDNVRADESGSCILRLEETFVSLSCPPSGTQLMLSVPVAVIPQDCPQEVLEMLLEANAFMKESAGGAFALVPEKGWVILNRNLFADALDEMMLYEAIMNVVDVSLAFGKRIDEITLGLSADGAEHPEDRGQISSVDFAALAV